MKMVWVSGERKGWQGMRVGRKRVRACLEEER